MSGLRPYQVALVERCAASFQTDGRAGIMQLATGGGKTHTAAEILRRAVALGQRCVFAAHLDTLIGDTHARLTAAGIPAGFVQAGRAASPLFPVQVCSLATLHARQSAPPADLVILDECHRAMAPTVRGILGGYPDAWILGLTATPQRGDGQPLGDAGFKWMHQGPTVRQLTAEGSLVPCDLRCLGEPSEKLARDPVDAYLEYGDERRALFFATSVEHASEIVMRLRLAQIPAELITGETPREVREGVRERVTLGITRALVSVNVFLEGFDLPAAEVIVLARGCTTVSSFLQAVGRGLRPSPSTGKRSCLVLDLKGAALLMGLPDEDRAWSLTGKPRRTEKIQALRRCENCWALFRPAPVCPACGASCAGQAREMPRVMTRAEKLESLSALPQDKRDAKYLRSLVWIAHSRMRMQHQPAREWAMRQFQKRFGREPECQL